MKFTPKQLDGNVNISSTHPLIELLWLLGGLTLLVGLFFFIIGATADWAVSKTPINVETWIGELALDEFPGKENHPLEKRLQALLDNLPADSVLYKYKFRVFLVDTEVINAVALPGGNIIVYSGLLKILTSENELAMVLAHELGHFAHRDHLRSLGRGLAIAVATTLLFGEGSSASSLVSKTLLTFQAQYSQDQETAADQFGLDLLVRRYGHAGGATEFFSRLADKAGSKLPYLLASHPHPQVRIDALNERIEFKHYATARVQPLSPVFLTSQ
jgi:predicted Zn-dependent protease